MKRLSKSRTLKTLRNSWWGVYPIVFLRRLCQGGSVNHDEIILEWHKSHSGLATKHDLEKLEHKIMSAIGDLQASVAALQAASTVENSAVLAAISDINSLPASDAALVPLTTAITAVAASLTANAAQLTKAIGTGGTVTPPATSPTLAAISTVSVAVAAGAQTVALTGIGSTVANPTITVTVSASDNGAVISAPVVTYTSPATTASLAFTPVAAGTSTVTVTVADGVGSAVQTFVVTVA